MAAGGALALKRSQERRLVTCDCSRRSDGGVSVIGACGCPVHGMKALHRCARQLLETLAPIPHAQFDWHEVDIARQALWEALDV